jgi:hypothetical protein
VCVWEREKCLYQKIGNRKKKRWGRRGLKKKTNSFYVTIAVVGNYTSTPRGLSII